MANDINKNPRSRFLHGGAFVSIGAAVLALVFAGGLWPSNGSDNRIQPPSQPAAEARVARPYSAPMAPDLDGPVILRLHNPDISDDLAVQVAMDEFISASMSWMPRRDVSVVVASDWLSEQELNELNQVRASFGEPPLRVVDVW